MVLNEFETPETYNMTSERTEHLPFVVCKHLTYNEQNIQNTQFEVAKQ